MSKAKIILETENGERIDNNDTFMPAVPRQGETLIYNESMYVVLSVTWENIRAGADARLRVEEVNDGE